MSEPRFTFGDAVGLKNGDSLLPCAVAGMRAEGDINLYTIEFSDGSLKANLSRWVSQGIYALASNCLRSSPLQ